MKNIWQIFKRDVLRIRTNVIAMIVIGRYRCPLPVRMV